MFWCCFCFGGEGIDSVGVVEGHGCTAGVVRVMAFL
jgi:hypothetical protein